MITLTTPALILLLAGTFIIGMTVAIFVVSKLKALLGQ